MKIVKNVRNSEVAMTLHCFMKRMNHTWFHVSLMPRLLILLSLLVACQPASADRPKDVPGALLFPSDATNVQFSIVDGTQQVYYQIKSCYPGKKVIEELSRSMLQKSWILLKEDFLNPGLRSNHARGEWSTF